MEIGLRSEVLKYVGNLPIRIDNIDRFSTSDWGVVDSCKASQNV